VRIGCAAALLTAVCFAWPSMALAAPTDPTPNPAPTSPGQEYAPSEGMPYPGNPATEPARVAAEDARIKDVRSMTSTAAWRGVDTTQPYRLATGRRISLVLVPRERPYDMAELAEISPSSVKKQSKRSYLVREHVVVLNGATLTVTKGQQVRLASDATGFSSVVTLGGTLDVRGSAKKPATFVAWDPYKEAPDTTTADGRGYIRLLGGRSLINDARFSDLGFWSGRTGGLAITGDSEPDHAAAGQPPENPKGQKGVPVVKLKPKSSSDLPASAKLTNISVAGSAFGLFVADATDVTLADATISGALVDGIVLHRGVRATTLTDVRVDRSGKDGVVVSRDATGISLKHTSVTDNGRNGLTMDGRALALGPMDGDAITPFSGNAVAGGEFLRNQRYGIEVLGGHGTSVQGAAIGKNSIGLVASEAATDVVVDGNTFTGPHEQAVSVRDGAAKITIRNNTVRGSATGIYNRNAQSIIERNTISEASVHGITVVGQAAGTVVTGNTISGRGPAALDMDRAVGLVAENNVSDGWIVSRSLEAVLAGIFKPLTVVWMLVVLAVLVPIRVRLKSRSMGIVDPFEAQAPLSSVSRGIVDRQLIQR
jgi:hypothetical protein